jgi:hypothetical protein
VHTPSKCPPTALTCPECGGSLWETPGGSTVHYECHVGHSYGIETLASDRALAVEGALAQEFERQTRHIRSTVVGRRPAAKVAGRPRSRATGLRAWGRKTRGEGG